MPNLAVPISIRENGTSPRDPQLPPFSESLTFSQRFPCMVVVGGLALTIAAGVIGLAFAVGSSQ